MSDDIIAPLKESLRKGYELGDGSICLISARALEAYIVEIERLQAENTILRKEYNEGQVVEIVDLRTKNVHLRTEIERLRAEVECWRDAADRGLG